MRFPPAAAVAALVFALTGCSSTSSGTAPVAPTPNPEECREQFVKFLTASLANADSEADFKADMESVQPGDIPACIGLNGVQRQLVKGDAETEVAPLMLARAAEWAGADE